jgi:hypothetical protein
MISVEVFMNTSEIIATIDAEIEKLQQAKAILGGAEVGERGPGRPKSTGSKKTKK